jgi:hypothetical protein
VRSIVSTSTDLVVNQPLDPDVTGPVRSLGAHASDLCDLVRGDHDRHRRLRDHRTHPPLSTSVRRFLREQSISLFFLIIFFAAIVGQAIAGHELYNQEQAAHGGEGVSIWRYVVSSHFGNSVMENWQSEYLQFMVFMLATVWQIQRGSPESKQPGREGTGSDQAQRIGPHAGRDAPGWARRRGIRATIYSNSLLIVMTIIFVGSWLAQSVTGWTEFNSEQQAHGEATVSWVSYIGSATFWEATLENWQSEFLAVGSFIALTIFLRQRGSPESKPVGAPHEATGVEGGGSPGTGA